MNVGNHMFACISFAHSGGSSRPKDHIRTGRVLGHLLSSRDLKAYLFQPKDFPGSSDGKASAYNVGDPGLIPGSGRSSGEVNGNPLQYS